jgi:glutamate synthase domain-containing protein 2/glutamate synthase domain-containing protein 3
MPHSMMMMVPEAFGTSYHISTDKRAFYEYHAAIMEPWDGPAAMIFTDGRIVGGTLDRNGLRPCRYTITTDGLVVLASEVGVIDFPPEQVQSKGRLQPGRMFLVDTEEGRIIGDNEIKAKIARQKPYRRWLQENRIELRGLFSGPRPVPSDPETIARRMRAFGYTREELQLIIGPMAQNGQEAVGSMGTDTPLAVLSDKPKLLFNYFKQLFAQVTNPPVDPLREGLVMSLMTFTGREKNLLDETPEHCRQLKLPHPILTNEDIERLRATKREDFKVATIYTVFDVGGATQTPPSKQRLGVAPDVQAPCAAGGRPLGEHGNKDTARPEGRTPTGDTAPAEGGTTNGLGANLKQALDNLVAAAEQAVLDGAQLLILSDREISPNKAAIPSLLAVGAVHHGLLRKGLRSETGIIVESGEPREVMHFALLVGYGAKGINPYLACEVVHEMQRNGELPKDMEEEHLVENYITAIKKGLLKIMSKMGISTLRSYHNAQLFEAVGLSREVVDAYFRGTSSRIEGVGLDVIAREALARHRSAFGERPAASLPLDFGGEYHHRRDGEDHLWQPLTVACLQNAVRFNDPGEYKEYARLINEQSEKLFTLRGLIDFAPGKPVPIDEVEPASEIVKRFVTGAMSHGSISKEAHEALAVAMNRLGGASNTGEGGEAEYRYEPGNEDLNSGIKQIASGRFGVTINYISHARNLQIKMAQGAKPGEGGQLPGHKVTEEIAHLRHSTAGVSLISPPPHHDIYSIEDLAQLIYDLKSGNPEAKVSVKLVAEVGVGTVAAGVAKANADEVLIAGHDGGTGASPWSSIKHAGVPWELGLAETQQVLVMNNLRDRIRVQVDGQIRTGRDVVIGALLGAEQFGFGTVALVTLGCIMMRKCHLGTCPVGIATQDPQLRKKFAGKAEHVERFMLFVAEDARRIMAQLGFRTFDEMVGQVDKLGFRKAQTHWKAAGLDLSPLLVKPDAGDGRNIRCVRPQPDRLASALDWEIIEKAKPAIEGGQKVRIEMPIRNVHRAVGAILSNRIVKACGPKGLPDNSVELTFRGSAGQSFGAWLAPGVTLRLIGEANDYVGKGLSGGRIVVQTPPGAAYAAHENIIVGNTVLYGATAGEMYINGLAGERFAVRNSGVVAVVEGVGDHGCEYMTNGVVVVLGPTGHNFAAGMSGGTAYVLDEHQLFDTLCNLDMVDIETVWHEKDRKILSDLLTQHYRWTGSWQARRILDDWAGMVGRFVKVMPIDYRKVMERLKEHELPQAEFTPATEEVFRRA